MRSYDDGPSDIWMRGTATVSNAGGVEDVRNQINDLKHTVGRLALLNQALWELLQKHLNLSEDELCALAEAIDARDGKVDGELSEHAVRCPRCSRVCGSRHPRCLYCGQEFQVSLFGSSHP